MEISIQSDESADVSKFSQLNTTLIFLKHLLSSHHNLKKMKL